MSEPLTAAERVWLAEVGMRVRLGRVAHRQSQEQLAAGSGVSRVTVGSIERADHAAAVVSYARLARALDLALADLLDGAP